MYISTSLLLDFLPAAKVVQFLCAEVFSVSTAKDVHGHELCGGCVLTWLETEAPVQLDETGETKILTDTGGLIDPILHSIELPCRR